MNKILLILATLFLSACEILIEDLDGSIVIIVKEAGVDAEVPDATVDSSVDMDASHENDTGVVDSAVDMDATVDAGSDSAVDVSHMHEAGMDSAVDASVDSAVADSGHSHMDAMTDGINIENIPVGHPGFSDRRIASTSEQPTPGTDGEFRTECAYSHMNFDDPIVYPGQKNAAHMHTFFGNKLVDAYTTTDSLLSSGNSTCRGGIINRSSYWVPSLIAANGDPLEPVYSVFYYKTGYDGVRHQDIKPIPQGLKVVAGYKDGPEDAAQWGCLNEYIGWHDTIQSCSDGIILLTIRFPQCSDGRLDSPDHRSHMSYANNGCPSSHPTPFTQITLNVGWQVNNINGVRLSSDIMMNTPPGVSGHGDFISGWEKDVINQWTVGCINSGSDCHAHLLSNGQMMY